jgi:hypothetical protein
MKKKNGTFILDAGLKIYVFHGSKVNKREKVKGIEVAININNDFRDGIAEIIVFDSETLLHHTKFWSYFGSCDEETKQTIISGIYITILYSILFLVHTLADFDEDISMVVSTSEKSHGRSLFQMSLDKSSEDALFVKVLSIDGWCVLF